MVYSERLKSPRRSRDKFILFGAFCVTILVGGYGIGGPAETTLQSTRHEMYPYMPYLVWKPGPEYADQDRMFQGIPSIAVAPGGRLWATWYGGGVGEGSENYVMLATSGDDGKTWSDIQLVIDPPYRSSEPAVWVDPKGTLWLMWNQYPLELRGVGSQFWVMTCDNPDAESPDWASPRLIAMELNNFNKPTVLKDGRWLWPSGCWRFEDMSRPLFSADHGKSFRLGGPINVPSDQRQCDEYMVIERKDGTLWLLIRTRYGIGESFSQDGGKTWSEVAPVANIRSSVTRFFITRLHSGNLLLVKNGPIDKKVGRSQLMAFISDDDGQSWSNGLMLDERSDQGSALKGVSYPDGVQHSDATIYIVYDYGRQTAKEILMAVFTEADVLAGKPVSDKARFKILVNKAHGKNPRVK